MPANVDYKHISTSRLRALEIAGSQLNVLYKRLADAEVIAPAVIEQVRVIQALVRRANGCVDTGDMELLEKTFGKKLEPEKPF